MNGQTVTLDVRDDLRKGCAPFTKIMDAVARLRPEEKLLLVAPFEPTPLFGVLAQQGFSHAARRIENGDWEVLFEREVDGRARHSVRADEPGLSGAHGVARPTNVENSALRAPHSALLEVDARGLEPPQPMVKILETLATLPQGTQLLARTDRRPMHLYPQLEARGFTGETQEEDDGSFITHIRRS